MHDVQTRERTTDDIGQGHRTRPASDIRLLPGEARLAATRPSSVLDDPDLAGNPVALAHARAAREHHAPSRGEGSPVGTALFFLVAAPALIFLVSNPLGLLLLFGLCLGFGYLFGFGGIL
jgi:hypothetical protein